MGLMKLNDKISLHMKLVVKEQQLAEKNIGFPQNIDADEDTMENLLWQFTKMDHISDRSDDENGIFSESPQTDILQEDVLELDAEHDQDLQSEQDEQELDQSQHKDSQMCTSLQFSEEDIPELSQETMFLQLNHWNAQMDLQVKELRADHMGWMEKSNNIIQKINLTENTLKSLLNEVMSLEGQIEKLKSPQDLDPDQGARIEEKIMETKKQLEEMDSKFVQADVCNAAHELKEKLVARIENFCKYMTVLNTKLGKYQIQEGSTDSQSAENMNMGEMEPWLLQPPPTPSEQSSPPQITMWKRVLRIFVMFYVLMFTGLSGYMLLCDATFIFERVLPSIIGHRRRWELRKIITPCLNLAVEDLLPS